MIVVLVLYEPKIDSQVTERASVEGLDLTVLCVLERKSFHGWLEAALCPCVLSFSGPVMLILVT